jgi:hypothetical protein
LEATSRAIMSTVGPGGTGTTMVIGLAVGQVCCAEAGTRAAKMESPHRIAVIERNVLMIQLGSVYFGGFHSSMKLQHASFVRADHVVIFVKSALRHRIASLILRHQPVSRGAGHCRLALCPTSTDGLQYKKTNNCASRIPAAHTITL